MRQNIVDSSVKDFGSMSKTTSEESFDNKPKIEFPGQQTGERVLYRAKMSSTMKVLTMVAIVGISLFFLILFQTAWAMFSGSLTGLEPVALIMPFTFVLTIIIAGIILWWTNRVFDQTEIFITDRRMIKFLPLVPYRTSARALFWEEVIKVKTYYKNAVLEKIIGIGSIEVHGRNHEADNIEMDYLIYHEDLGNYVDKILYVYKNKPEELTTFKKFIPKPVGKRD